MASKPWHGAAVALIVMGVVGLLIYFYAEPKQRVTVYCALDREFAEAILKEFEGTTGIEVVKRYDTEANKSFGLYQDLMDEKARPRCDVHWNNEILATIRLQRAGIYAPYESPAALPFPAQFKATDHSWTAFAARARVLIVNTTKVKDADIPKGLEDLTQPMWKGRVAMAKPLFGTTATQAACLFQAWGPVNARGFFDKLKVNDVQIVDGNKRVAVGVGVGQFDGGLTDTDDALAEIDQGRPVKMIFLDAEAPEGSGRGTLFIPNTVALVKNGPNAESGKKLIDYLLSAAVEKKLAEGAGRQIPLNPKVEANLPDAMRPALTARRFPVDFGKAADAWEESQRFMKDRFALR